MPRKPVYFRPRKDEDLINYFKQYEDKDDFSHVARELWRDGMKYRKLQKSGRIVEQYVQPVQQNSVYDNVTQSNTPKNTPDFSQVEMKEKEISKDELESRLDDF